MSKLRINKKFIAFLLAGSITVGGITLILGSQKRQEAPKSENELGYTNINPIFNNNVDPEDFIVLDMGDHNDVRTRFENEKATYCNENDITLGVIISSNSETESDIYNDVEYTKGLIKKYDIGFPVYLDINRIITNDNLNNEMKTKLIKDFIEKCSANNIYVGIYGTDTNLCRVREYCGITECDAFVVMDKDTVEYPGTYSVYQDLEGNVKSVSNVATVISEKALNQANQFANDGAYTVTEGEDLTDIALRYGMSVNELLKFNDMKKSDVTAGIVLRIPSIIDKTVSGDIEETYSDVETPLRGCDLSYAQGNDINWEQMSENFEFIILRCAQGISTDSSFETNAINANINNIPIGAYCYNDYTLDKSESKEDFIRKQEEQANYVLELLKNKKIDYPVYLDIEPLTDAALSEQYDAECVNSMIDVWCNKMTSSGYIPGIYCNQSVYKYLQSCVDYDLAGKLEVWIAGGEQFTGGAEDIPLEDVVPSEFVKENNPDVSIVQSTDSAKGAGAGNHEGHLNVSFSYRDYTSKEVTGDIEEAFPIKEFQRTDTVVVGTGLAAGCVVATILGVGGVVTERKKQNGKYIAKTK